MQELPQNITGTFETDEKNFVNLLGKMLSGTIDPIFDTHSSLSISHEIKKIVETINYPMSEEKKREIGSSIQKFVLQNKHTGDDLLKAGKQFNSILGMLDQYAQVLFSPVKPIEKPVEVSFEDPSTGAKQTENLPETC